MKYFKISTSRVVEGIVPPGMNGTNVIDKEEFFDNGKCGPDRFYDKDYVFDYLTPIEFGAGRENEQSNAIYDYHLWFGEAPFGGWFKPISHKFKNVLEKFNLGPHRFYTAWVLFQKEKHPYYVMQILQNYYQEFIDFEKTLFNNLDSSRDVEDRVFEIKQFSSIQDVEDYSESNWDSSVNWNYERVVMKPEFKDLDFVTFFKFGDIVSERLKIAIEDSGLKGMEFGELPIPIEFSDEL